MRTRRRWGRFTARGGPEVEAEVASLVERAGEIVAASLPRDAYRALLLIGGYGRGEGGVERRDGVERPHNNLDFLLVTTPRGSAGRGVSKGRLDALLRPLSAEAGVGIDTGVISEWKLRLSPCLVLWSDMRFGHKTVAGDPSFVPSLTRFREEAIEPSDVLHLLVNRGTLLVINDLLLARGAGSAEDRRTVVKHAMKAVIGYGDAWLFAAGEYDASYLEKQRRMRARRDAPAALRALYDEALEFRFEPSYERYLERDPGAWMDRLREDLAPIHLAFERRRLGAAGLTWSDYADRALRHALLEAPLSPWALARKGKGLLGSAWPSAAGRAPGLLSGLDGRRFTLPGASVGESLWMDLAARCGGPKGALAVAFPAVLYGAGGPRQAELARRLLGAADPSPAELRRAYLERWQRGGDTNFPALVERLGLALAPRDPGPAGDLQGAEGRGSGAGAAVRS